MTVKASRALKAALAIGAVALLSLSLVAMSACSDKVEVEEPEEGNLYVENLESLPTPEEVGSSIEVVGYLNTVLKNQTNWHSKKVTESYSNLLGSLATTTTTFKDYKDGVLIAEELVNGTGAGSHQFMFLADTDDERSVYVRTGSAPSSVDAVPNDITWDTDGVEYWSEAYYNITYGLFMDQISLYVLNEGTLLYTYDDDGETILDDGIGELEKDGDNYTITFDLDTVYSVYYYAYSQMNHSGGLMNSTPTFSYANVTFTFNEDWEVLEMYEEDKTSNTFTGSTSKTTTTFSYDEEDFDETTYAAGIAFFEPLEGTLEMQRTEEEILAAEQGDEAGDDVETEEDGDVETEPEENADLSSQDVEYTQYEKNLTLTVVMAIVVGVVIVLGIILTGVGCSAGGKKKNAQQSEDDEKKN